MKFYTQFALTSLGAISLLGVVLLISTIGEAWQQRIAANDPVPGRSERFSELQVVHFLIAGASQEQHLGAIPITFAMSAELDGQAEAAHSAMADLALADGYPQLAELHREAAEVKE